MATPYLQIRQQEVRSTQDLARAELDRLPVVVVAERQTAGRGRGDAEWITASRALATSVAFRAPEADRRPFSLMAGVAAVRALDSVNLKWPNDVMIGDLKVGGILVERSGEDVVVGMGLNLWWPGAPDEVGALHPEDPGPGLHGCIAGVWAAELLASIATRGWPLDEYRSSCLTIGRQITWEPQGRGQAIDVNRQGELLVEEGGSRRTVNSGAIRHLRARPGP